MRTEFSRGQTTGARRALNRRAVRFRIWRWRPLIGHWTVPFIFFFFIFTQTDTLRETSPLHWLRCVRNNRHIIRRVRREVKVCTLCARFYSTPMQYAPSNYRYCITSMMRRKVSFNLKRNIFFPFKRKWTFIWHGPPSATFRLSSTQQTVHLPSVSFKLITQDLAYQRLKFHQPAAGQVKVAKYVPAMNEKWTKLVNNSPHLHGIFTCKE